MISSPAVATLGPLFSTLSSAEVSIFVSKVKVLLLRSLSVVSEVRVTVFEREPSIEGLVVPVTLIVLLSPALIVLKVQRLVLPLSGEGEEDENRKLVSYFSVMRTF